jgi:hypothetical protein
MNSKRTLPEIITNSTTFFPSIPSPRNRRNNQSLVISKSIIRTLSPKSISNPITKDGLNVTKEEKVVSNFLLKYLSRK